MPSSYSSSSIDHGPAVPRDPSRTWEEPHPGRRLPSSTDTWKGPVQDHDHERRMGYYRDATAGRYGAAHGAHEGSMVQKAYRAKSRSSRRRGNRSLSSVSGQVETIPRQLAPTEPYPPTSMPASELAASPVLIHSASLHTDLMENVEPGAGLEHANISDHIAALAPLSPPELSGILVSGSLSDDISIALASDDDGVAGAISRDDDLIRDAYGWEAEWDRRLDEIGSTGDIVMNLGSNTSSLSRARGKGRKATLLQRVLSIGSNGSFETLGR